MRRCDRWAQAAEIDVPGFPMETYWDLSRLLGYFQSWSATKRFADATGYDAIEMVRAELEEAWGDPHASRRIRWPLALRVGRTDDAGQPRR